MANIQHSLPALEGAWGHTAAKAACSWTKAQFHCFPSALLNRAQQCTLHLLIPLLGHTVAHKTTWPHTQTKGFTHQDSAEAIYVRGVNNSHLRRCFFLFHNHRRVALRDVISEHGRMGWGSTWRSERFFSTSTILWLSLDIKACTQS